MAPRLELFAFRYRDPRTGKWIPLLPPSIDAIEVFLVRLFLRSYIAYCARRRRFAAMNGDAQLFAELSHPRGTV